MALEEGRRIQRWQEQSRRGVFEQAKKVGAPLRDAHPQNAIARGFQIKEEQEFAEKRER